MDLALFSICYKISLVIEFCYAKFKLEGSLIFIFADRSLKNFFKSLVASFNYFLVFVSVKFVVTLT